jgi:hypothetical protein
MKNGDCVFLVQEARIADGRFYPKGSKGIIACPPYRLDEKGDTFPNALITVQMQNPAGEITIDSAKVSMLSPIPEDSYWDRTSRIQQNGQNPECCGEPMAPEDEHGRFVCFSCGRRVAL